MNFLQIHYTMAAAPSLYFIRYLLMFCETAVKHDFFCTDPEEMYFEPLRKVAGYFKNNEAGVGKMSRIMEEVREEGWIEGRAEGKTEEKMETILQMLNLGGFSLETIAAIARLSVEEVRAIAEKHFGAAHSS